jgi:sulfite reductase (ferredoxin)
MLPARNVPAFLLELLRAFRDSAAYPDFDAYLDSGGRETAAEIIARHKSVAAATDNKDGAYDWGADEPFSLAGRGPGECSAGVFDLIGIDLASARQALDEGDVLAAVQSAARALLITKGEDAQDAETALRLFESHFLDAGLVDDSFQDLVAGARTCTTSTVGAGRFDAHPARVSTLIDAVETLYENMDPSLTFKAVPQRCGPTCACVQETPPAAREDVEIHREADLRGVTCPLNYVKTKLLLGQVERGQILAVLLDDAGGRSVPESAAKDGHEVVATQKEGDGWRVLIRRQR